MRVIITGPSGIGKRNLFANLEKLCNNKDISGSGCDEDVKLEPSALKNAKIDRTCDLENLMCEIKGLRSKNYLEREPKILETEKNDTLRHIMAEIDNSFNVVLGMHATYYRQSSLYHILDWSELRKFKPDMFITLIDDVFSIYQNLHSGGRDQYDYARTLTHKDVLWWREAEITATQMLSNNLITEKKLPHFIVPVGHGTQIIYQLMFESKEFGKDIRKKKVYASYPVTSGDDAMRNEKDRLIKELKQFFIVFDPLTIAEKLGQLELNKNLEEAIPDDEIHIQKGTKTIPVQMKDIIPIIHNITGQIISRDERLVEQCDMVVSLKPSQSSGAMHEVERALATGRVETRVIDMNRSPFTGRLPDKMYDNLDQLILDLPSIAKGQ